MPKPLHISLDDGSPLWIQLNNAGNQRVRENWFAHYDSLAAYHLVDNEASTVLSANNVFSDDATLELVGNCHEIITQSQIRVVVVAIVIDRFEHRVSEFGAFLNAGERVTKLVAILINPAVEAQINGVCQQHVDVEPKHVHPRSSRHGHIHGQLSGCAVVEEISILSEKRQRDNNELSVNIFFKNDSCK